jgi:hypothetical protein
MIHQEQGLVSQAGIEDLSDPDQSGLSLPKAATRWVPWFGKPFDGLKCGMIQNAGLRKGTIMQPLSGLRWFEG